MADEEKKTKVEPRQQFWSQQTMIVQKALSPRLQKASNRASLKVYGKH